MARHLADRDFWKAYDLPPIEIQAQANIAFELLKQNPKHPPLHFKKIGRRWSARVGIKYRALALEIEDGFLCCWIRPARQLRPIDPPIKSMVYLTAVGAQENRRAGATRTKLFGDIHCCNCRDAKR